MVTVTPPSTPWGPAGAVILCLLPLGFLVLVTVVKRLILPTYVSLPISAVMLAFIRMAYLSTPSNFVMACMFSGLLEALTPLSIICGAIMLFQTMQHTKCLPWIMVQIKGLSAGHPVAEVFLIGFSFAYLVEGASGFGTPVALAAPMLASLGHAPIPTVVCLLIMNTLATQFGAVGTPIWFGFGDLGLGEQNLQLIGLKAAIIVGVVAYIIAPIAASFLVPWKQLLRSALFVVLAISTAVGPSIGVAAFSYEFPSLIGGLISIALTGVLIKFKVGLAKYDEEDLPKAAPPAPAGSSAAVAVDSPATVLAANDTKLAEDLLQPSVRRRGSSFPNATIPIRARSTVMPHGDSMTEGSVVKRTSSRVTPIGSVTVGHHHRHLLRQESIVQRIESDYSVAIDKEEAIADAYAEVRPPITAKDLFLRTLPLTITIFVLLITRIPQLKIKGVFQSIKPSFYWDLGTFGRFGISASLVVQLLQIFTEPTIRWRYEVLYVPFFLPFVVASLLTILVHRKDMEVPAMTPIKEAFERILGISVATLGALMLVSLIRNGGPTAPAYYIGYYLSTWLREGFLAISAFLGGLGSFFSGSTTVSNLTFGDIQKIAAQQINVPVTGMLAVQVAGATMGNMICINNILGAKAVMNMNHVGEGEFIRRTAPVALLMALLAQAVGLLFTIGRIMPDYPFLKYL